MVFTYPMAFEKINTEFNRALMDQFIFGQANYIQITSEEVKIGVKSAFMNDEWQFKKIEFFLGQAHE